MNVALQKIRVFMGSIRMTFGAATHPGTTRKSNQDQMAWVHTENGAQNGVQNGAQALFVVADGMGGHRGGEEASRLAVHTVCEHFEKNRGVAPAHVLESALTEANTAIRMAVRDNPMLNGMGTTCTALVIGEDQISIGHVGDSRAYVVENGSIEQVTDDHLAAQDIASRLNIGVEEAWQYTARNALSRALGPVDVVNVDIVRRPLAAGQQWLLCTDGLLELAPDRLRELLQRSPAQDAAEALVREAVRVDGSDNATCIVVNIHEVSE